MKRFLRACIWTILVLCMLAPAAYFLRGLDGPTGTYFYTGRVISMSYTRTGDLHIDLDPVTVEGCTADGRGSCMDVFTPADFFLPAGAENQITLGKIIEVKCDVLPMLSPKFNRTTCVLLGVK